MQWSDLLNPEYFTQMLTKCNGTHANGDLPVRTCRTSELHNITPQGTALTGLVRISNSTNASLTMSPQDYTVMSFDLEGIILSPHFIHVDGYIFSCLLYSEFRIILEIQVVSSTKCYVKLYKSGRCSMSNVTQKVCYYNRNPFVLSHEPDANWNLSNNIHTRNSVQTQISIVGEL